jgi:hypothetical protein
LYHVLGKGLTDNWKEVIPRTFHSTTPYTVTHEANGAVDPVTKQTITKYDTLMNDPHTMKVWRAAFCKELGRLVAGWNDTERTGTVVFMSHDQILRIPKDRTVTYARIVVDYRPQKEDPNRVRITCGSNLINYPGKTTMRTADLITAKIRWNSFLSTSNARCLCADVKNFYLETGILDRFEYMKMPARLIPVKFMTKYQLYDKVNKGFIYMEIQKGIYGLPQAGILANKLLRQRLATDGYYE